MQNEMEHGPVTRVGAAFTVLLMLGLWKCTSGISHAVHKVLKKRERKGCSLQIFQSRNVKMPQENLAVYLSVRHSRLFMWEEYSKDVVNVALSSTSHYLF